MCIRDRRYVVSKRVNNIHCVNTCGHETGNKVNIFIVSHYKWPGCRQTCYSNFQVSVLRPIPFANHKRFFRLQHNLWNARHAHFTARLIIGTNCVKNLFQNFFTKRSESTTISICCAQNTPSLKCVCSQNTKYSGLAPVLILNKTSETRARLKPSVQLL